ncbi:hypothetical protein Kfla_4715 [Kribbella flavida DSM 17836]|uniref:Uncharacterized protein n=1 Tax=Kribbella flavida (strain DSM 17836 / JCM 10339 / NBRC 14399) TaxID=479435 RepID=D2PZC3_KRIFD|nr:hypothetical protein [Kribbella flavida]ADB33732.1 hypothetical protein Kfla_4715 [Kribbella flavida DSM 17836]
MTELRTLLDEIAGPDAASPDTFVAETIARGRRTRRRRRITAVMATATAAAGAAAVTWTLPPVSDVPAASDAAAQPTTCAQLTVDYGLRAFPREDPNAPGVTLVLDGFDSAPTEAAQRGSGRTVVHAPQLTIEPKSTAVLEVPPPGPNGWSDDVWQQVINTCYRPK